jgi:hypothetical protein
MSVPLPSAQDVNLERPSAAEAQSMTDAVASIVGGHDGLLPLQQRLLVAIFSAMTEHAVTLEGRPLLTVPEAAASFARRDLQFRSRMVQTMLLCALVRRPISEDVVRDIAGAAAELGVRDGMVDVAQDFAAGSLGLAAVDFTRNGYEGGWNAEEAAAAVHASHPLGSAWAFCEDDEEMAAQWRSLEHLSADTLGRKVWEMYRARGFAFPGTPGSAPPMLTQHDWVHVLADYGTTVESEVEVFGFIARSNDDLHAFSLLAMVISLFETGYLETGAGLFEHSEGHFSSSPHMEVRLADAMYRGAVCRDTEAGHDSVDFLTMDWFAIAHRSCADLRVRFNLVPKSAAAREAGAVGPWEPGGISPFQLAAGRALAAASGVPYDAHGASA